MRAIAISMVLIAHAMFIFKDFKNPLIDVIHIFGFLGVEIFFVLSGFLIGGILFQLFKSKEVSFKDLTRFWMRRWFRTLPLYFLFLIVNILIAVGVGFELPKSLWKYLFFLQNFSTTHIPFFPESWSLSVEEYAYLIAPLSLFSFLGIFKKQKHVTREKLFLYTSLLLVILFLITKIIYNIVNHDISQNLELWNSNLKALVIYRLDAIFYGFVLVYFFETNKALIKRLKNILCFIGCMIIFVTLVLVPSSGFTIENNSWYWNVFYLPCNSIGIAMILPFLFYLETANNSIKLFINNMSIYSYSMYLLHYTCLLYIMEMLIEFEGLNMFYRIIWVVIYLIITYFFSKVIYTYFEKPITDLRDRWKS